MEYGSGYERPKEMEGNKIRALAISAFLTCSEDLLREENAPPEITSTLNYINKINSSTEN